MLMVDGVVSDHVKYWVPIHWSLNMLSRARDEGRIDGDVIYDRLVNVSRLTD